MELKIEQGEGAKVVELVGDVDLNVVQDVRKVLLEEVNQEKRVFVDLKGVSMIDSSGVACLIEAYQLSRQLDTSFGLIAVSNNVGRVLKLAHLDQIFPQYKTIEQALTD